MISRIKTVKMRLIAGIGSTLPMQVSAINKGYDPKANLPPVHINCKMTGGNNAQG